MTGTPHQPDASIPGRKWFGQYSTSSGHAAASELLAERASRLSRCIEAARTDPAGKRIKKLRVATRRADIAARFAIPLAEAGVVKRARRSLRTLRRAGGAVRRCDVFIARLQETASAAEGDDVGLASVALIGRLSAERAQALRAFIAALADDRAEKAMKAITVGADDSVGARDLAVALIADSRAAFTEFSTVPTLDLEALHTLRLRGKRLRYTAEAVAPLIDDSAAASLINAVTPLQDELGRVNDLAELAAELQTFHAEVADLEGARRLRAGVDRLLLAAASERDRRAVAFSKLRRERVGAVTEAIDNLKPRPGFRLIDHAARSETA